VDAISLIVLTGIELSSLAFMGGGVRLQQRERLVTGYGVDRHDLSVPRRFGTRRPNETMVSFSAPSGHSSLWPVARQRGDKKQRQRRIAVRSEAAIHGRGKPIDDGDLLGIEIMRAPRCWRARCSAIGNGGCRCRRGPAAASPNIWRAG